MSHRMACLKLLKHLTPHLTNVCRLMESSTTLTQGGLCHSSNNPPFHKKANVFVCYNSSEECALSLTHLPQQAGCLLTRRLLLVELSMSTPISWSAIPFFTRCHHFFKSRFIKTHIRSTINTPASRISTVAPPDSSRLGKELTGPGSAW